MKVSLARSVVLSSSLLVMLTSVSGFAANMLVNPGLETADSAGWAAWGFGWRLGSASDAYSGAFGLVDDVLPSDPPSESWRGFNQNFPISSGEVFTPSAYIRAVAIESSEAWLEVQFLNAANAVLSQYQSVHVTADQPFTPATVNSVTSPPNAVTISVRAIVHMSAPPTNDPDFFIFDDFQLHGSLSATDRTYLKKVASDTWSWINMRVSTNGLPYDDDRRTELTSVTDIGMYLSSVVMARDFGFISSNSAVSKLQKTINSVKKLQTWYGFQQCWNSVKTLKPGTGDTWVSIVDSGLLAAGLITVGQAFPQFRNDCDQLVNAMDWSAFYDPDRQLVRGGYNTATGQFGANWYLDYLGADSRMADFIAIGAGDIPATSWDALNRDQELWYAISYFMPGWVGGGLFMQYMPGLWLDETNTVMGLSAARFAQAQVSHWKINNYPVWGWSACASPSSGYLGWGSLQDDVVTPHACVLALGDMPVHTVANLRKLETYGARHESRGFYDSVEWDTPAVAKNMLMLDQGMLLLSIGDYLNQTNARTWFARSPIATNAYNLISDFQP
ncbi:MAG: glucoamylase family protein [Chloroflexota bacterium]